MEQPGDGPAPRVVEPAPATPDSASGLERVRRIVAEVLDLPPEEVLPTSRLFEDLGAHSIDIVELVYQLEVSFGLRLELLELFDQEFFKAHTSKSEREVAGDQLTRIRAAFPFLELPQVERLLLRELTNFYTVDSIARYVGWAKGRATAGTGASPVQTIKA